MLCPKCGMNYVPGNPKDESKHEEYCDLIVSGPSTRSVEDAHIIWHKGDDQIILITDSSTGTLKQIAHDLSTCANKEMRHDGGIYHSCEPPDERQIHLFVYARACRGIGLLIFEQRSDVWRCLWGGDTKPVCEYTLGLSPMWSVGLIWIQEQFRGAGLARQLLGEAQRFLKLSSGEFGWYTPFTPDGEALVRRLCPTEFFVAK